MTDIQSFDELSTVRDSSSDCVEHFLSCMDVQKWPFSAALFRYKELFPPIASYTPINQRLYLSSEEDEITGWSSDSHASDTAVHLLRAIRCFQFPMIHKIHFYFLTFTFFHEILLAAVFKCMPLTFCILTPCLVSLPLASWKTGSLWFITHFNCRQLQIHVRYFFQGLKTTNSLLSRKKTTSCNYICVIVYKNHAFTLNWNYQ